MDKITRPGAASYLLFGILFGAPAIFLAARSVLNHLPLLSSPMDLFAWSLPIAGWLYLSSLKLGITDRAIYFERFYFQRFEFQFADIVGVSFRLRRGPALDIRIRGKGEPVSVALAPFDKSSLSVFAQALKDNVKEFEDRISLTTNQHAT